MTTDPSPSRNRKRLNWAIRLGLIAILIGIIWHMIPRPPVPQPRLAIVLDLTSSLTEVTRNPNTIEDARKIAQLKQSDFRKQKANIAGWQIVETQQGIVRDDDLRNQASSQSSNDASGTDTHKDNSAYIDALSNASDWLMDSSKPSGKKTLIVVGDLLNDYGPNQHDPEKKWDPQKGVPIQVADSKRFADIQEIILIHPNTTRPDIDYTIIESNWRKYLKKCGAKDTSIQIKKF